MDTVDWIESAERLEVWLAGWSSGPLALDTEADSLHRYPERVCLIQLTVGAREALVDPLALPEPRALATPLARPLADPSRRKILHGADYDLRMLDRDFGLSIRGLFDTMIAARLTGERAFGLAALLEKHFDVRLDKRYQRADWSRRPLDAAMRRYAILDTRHLEDLCLRLEERLRALGRRSWAEEEFRRLEEVSWNAEPNGEAFRRIKGSGKLGRRSLAALAELVAVREERARELQRPPFKVLRNDVLLELARRVAEEDLRPDDVRGLPGPWSRRDRFAELTDALARARALAEEELPERRAGRRPRREPEVDRRVAAVIAGRDRLAEELDLESSLLAPRAVVEEIARATLAGEDPRTLEPLRTWQADLLEPVWSAL